MNGLWRKAVLFRRLLLLLLSFLMAACGERADQPVALPEPASVPADAIPTPSPPQRKEKVEVAVQPVATPSDEAGEIVAEEMGWTILIYAWAGDEREAAVLAGINAMEANGPPEGVNVVLHLDRGLKEVGDEGGWSGGRRYLLAADDDPVALGSTLLAEVEPATLGNSQTIADFVAWGSETYPAPSVAFWMWNADGWQATAAGSGSRDVPGLPGLGEALRTALDGNPVALVAVDSPAAAALSSLSAVQPYARYAVVPADPLSGGNWDYAGMLAEIAAAAPVGRSGLAQALVTGPAADEAGVVAIDLQALPQLLAAVETLGTALQVEPALVTGAVADAWAGARREVPGHPAQPGRPNTVDLGQFAAILAQQSPDAAVAGAAARFSETLQPAVLNAHGEVAGHAAGISIYFPPVVAAYDPGYESVAPAGWTDFLHAYYRVAAEIPPPMLELLQVAGASGGVAQPVFTAFELSGRNIEQVQVAAWRLEEGSARLVGTDFLLPEPHPLPDGSELFRWRDGVHETFYIWDTRAAYLTDGEAGEFVVTWPVAPGSKLHTVAGRLEAPEGTPQQDVALFIDAGSGSVLGVWGISGSAPRQILPSPEALFTPAIFRLAEDGSLRMETGAGIRFGEAGPAYTLQPLPVGDYQLRFEAAAVGGAVATAETEIGVNSEGYGGAVRAYLDPYYGFQFLLPSGWQMPQYEGSELVSADETGTVSLAVNRYPAGRRTSELKAQTLERFGAVDLLYTDNRTVADSRGELVAYAYDREGEARTGVFLAFVTGDAGYVVDVDGTASAEAETLAIVEQIAASWLLRPLGFGHVSGMWETLELAAFTVPVPVTYSHHRLDNGWDLLRQEGRFVALRRDPATGQSRAERVQHWLDVAREGVAGFDQSPLYEFGLSDRGWVRADFAYERDGRPVRGLVMTAVGDGEEIAAWAEAPAEQYDELVDGIFLALIAGAAGAPEDERLLYHAGFETPEKWGTGDEDGARGDITDGVYRLAVAADRGFFWTTAGESFGDGLYEVTATQLEGPLDNGYGLLLRAVPEAAAFYVFAVSGDGYVWIGRCDDGCGSMTTLVGDGWFAHPAVNQGLNVANRLRVSADGEQLHFFVNGEPVGEVVDDSLVRGDAGLFVETLGQGNVAVAFDDLYVYAR
jgi:hypothetical protein